MARSDLQLDPLLGLGYGDFSDDLPELAGRGFFPLGEAHHGHEFIAIAANGEVIGFMEEIYQRWPSFSAGLRGLLLGIRAADV